MESLKKNYIKWDEQRFEQKELMPNVIENPPIEMKREIYNIISVHELAALATSTPNGWPIVDCMHFGMVEGDNCRPVFYMFTHFGKRKLENIPNDSRVSVSLYNTPGFEKRNEA